MGQMALKKSGWIDTWSYIINDGVFSKQWAKITCPHFKCHLLRGRALRTLEMFTEALMDFTEAIKLDPKDATIEQEADQVRKIIESNGDTWKEEWETDLLAN